MCLCVFVFFLFHFRSEVFLLAPQGDYVTFEKLWCKLSFSLSTN